MTNFETLECSVTERVATIRLNRPDAANGLNTRMAEELSQAASEVAANDKVKAVILTGAGRFFCAGGDVKFMAAMGADVKQGIAHIADNLHAAIACFSRMQAPLVVAVNGMAAGAGFSTAICGDMVLAGESAKFTMAYTNVGLSPDGSSSYFMPRLIGLRKTQELMFTNRMLDADEALQWGLVNKVVPDAQLMAEAQALAEQFAAGPRGSYGAIKKLLLASSTSELEAQLNLETATIADTAASPDGREGVSAFTQKRAAEFS
ncbi:MAG: enoyl-CoA hydratase [Gammaproteobacteria bacterium]|nr:enoyl-CoA hydratase [Gammaproteobacteria bacterium]